MTFLTKLIISNVIAFWFLFTIWKKSDLFNAIFKFFLLALALMNSYELLVTLGYLFKR